MYDVEGVELGTINSFKKYMYVYSTQSDFIDYLTLGKENYIVYNGDVTYITTKDIT